MLNHSKLFPVTNFINKSATPLTDYTLTLYPSKAAVTYSGVTTVTTGPSVNNIYPTNYLTYGIGTDDSVSIGSFADLAKLNAPLLPDDTTTWLTSQRFAVSFYYGESASLIIGLGCKYDNLFPTTYDASYCTYSIQYVYTIVKAIQIAGVTTPTMKGGEFKVWRIALSPTDIKNLTTYVSSQHYNNGVNQDNAMSIAFFDSTSNSGFYNSVTTTNLNLYTFGTDGSPLPANRINPRPNYQLSSRDLGVTILYHPFKWLWSKARPDNTFAKITIDTTTAGVTTTTSGINLGPVAANTSVSSNLQIRNIDAVETMGVIIEKDWYGNPTGVTYPTKAIPVITTYAVTSLVITLQTSLASLSTASKTTLASEFVLSYTFKGVTTPITAFTATSTTITVPVSLTMACLDELTFNITYAPKLKLLASNVAQFAAPYTLAVATAAANATNLKRGVRVQLKGYPTGSTGGGVPDTVLSGTTAVALGDALSVIGTVL